MIAIYESSETATNLQQPVQRKTAVRASANPAWQPRFLALLPRIQRHAKLHFRNLSPELREELVQETTARALLNYLRLVERDQEHVASAGSLARYAVAQVRQGRRVGGRLNVRDITSHYSQQQTGAVVERLDRRDEESGGWREIVVENLHCGPDEIAATRIDFSDWLASLPKRNRHLAEKLAVGESTSCVARFFGITPGRVAQLRSELRRAWHSFQGEPVPTTL